MNSVHIRIRQLLPAIIIAFIAGYFFNWLMKEHLLSDDYLFTWAGRFHDDCSDRRRICPW
jgi:hypothetical protein